MTGKANSTWHMARRLIQNAIRHAPRATRSAGFTLIELLVVISIIGILTTVAVSSYSQQQKKARDGQRKFDLQNVRSALEQYQTQVNPQQYISGNSYSAMTTTLIGQKFIKVAPADPLSGTTTPYYYQGLQADGLTACDGTTTICLDYVLCAKLENSKDLDIFPQSSNYTCLNGTYNYGLHAQ